MSNAIDRKKNQWKQIKNLEISLKYKKPTKNKQELGKAR